MCVEMQSMYNARCHYMYIDEYFAKRAVIYCAGTALFVYSCA